MISENELWEAFPDTPEDIKKTVRQVVADQLVADKIRKGRFKPAVVAVTIFSMVLVGTTVGAVSFTDIFKRLKELGFTVPEEHIVQYEEQANEKSFQNAPLTYQEIVDGISEMEKKNLELLAQSLSRHGNVEEQTAEEIISKNWPAEPFLVMDELYTDGSSLYFSAHTPEGCSIRPTDTRDHAYVNGVDCMAEYFEASEEPGHFVGAIDLSTNFSDQDYLKIGEELAILIPLYTKPDTDRSDWTDWKLFSFSDSNWKEGVATRDLSGKEITLGEYGSVKLEKLLVSPSKIKIKMICTMVGDNAKELLDRYDYSKMTENVIKEFHFIDTDGNTYSMWGTEAHGYQDGIVNGAQGGHVEKLSDGNYRWEFEFSIEKNFDMDTDSIRIIPCTMKEDEEGKDIPGSEREIPELAFEVSLK